MYFPYLRGKQFELLALKEMSPILGVAKTVLPIIEPVRAPKGSGLGRCLSALTAEDLDFVLVMNPSVGSLCSPLMDLADDIVTFVHEHPSSSSWNLGLLLFEDSDVESLIESYASAVGEGRRLTLIHRGVAEHLDRIPALSTTLQREYDVIDDSLRQRHFRELRKTTRGVTLHDWFPREDRNAAYLDRGEAMFSEDHLYYQEEGWYGFSDYLTIGEPYSDGGFTPRAVVIHWTYESAAGKPLMIRHFTSESNGDTTNVGGKFLEAAGKLVGFLDTRDIHTQAAEVMRSHLADNTYPGLGIVKKLSIQNHLELVSEILNRS